MEKKSEKCVSMSECLARRRHHSEMTSTGNCSERVIEKFSAVCIRQHIEHWRRSCRTRERQSRREQIHGAPTRRRRTRLDRAGFTRLASIVDSLPWTPAYDQAYSSLPIFGICHHSPYIASVVLMRTDARRQHCPLPFDDYRPVRKLTHSLSEWVPPLMLLPFRQQGPSDRATAADDESS